MWKTHECLLDKIVVSNSMEVGSRAHETGQGGATCTHRPPKVSGVARVSSFGGAKKGVVRKRDKKGCGSWRVIMGLTMDRGIYSSLPWRPSEVPSDMKEKEKWGSGGSAP